VPTVVYATGDDFTDGVPSDEIVTSLRLALDEAKRVGR
jgi:hypothetical protein